MSVPKGVGESMRKRVAWLGLAVIVVGLAWLLNRQSRNGPLAAGCDGAQNIDLLAGRRDCCGSRGRAVHWSGSRGGCGLEPCSASRISNTLSGVVYQPHAFESVTNGLIWRRNPSNEARRAAIDALNGWDPSYGSIFFWNPYKPVSAWISSRPIVVQHGNHVFAR